MAAQLPDLRTFFNSVLSGGRLGASPGLGTGPSAMGRPTPGPVKPTAAGEGIRGLWGQLQAPERAGPRQEARVDRINANAPGQMLGSLFNRDAFPQIAAERRSPFPRSTALPVPAPQFPTDPKARPSQPGAGYRPPRQKRPAQEEQKPISWDDFRGSRRISEEEQRWLDEQAQATWWRDGGFR